jgi:hypothetical protein
VTLPGRRAECGHVTFAPARPAGSATVDRTGEPMTEPPAPPAENSESHWLANIYRGRTPQLTVRAVLFGMAIGAVMCLSNLYVFLKTG